MISEQLTVKDVLVDICTTEVIYHIEIGKFEVGSAYLLDKYFILLKVV